jgi:hypothetical protein
MIRDLLGVLSVGYTVLFALPVVIAAFVNDLELNPTGWIMVALVPLAWWQASAFLDRHP